MTQQALLFLRQQLVAPVERGSQGPVPRDRGAASAGQQREAIAQAGGHLLGSDKGGAGRGELDGERNAVEMPADLGDRRKILWLWREARVQCLCPGDEQLDGAVAEDDVGCLCSGAGTSSAGTR